MCVLMLDIDHFKRFNDTHGHITGDEVLKHVSKLMKTALRGTDFVARYGGEEFVIILHDIDVDNAGRVAEKIRTSIEKTPLVFFNGTSSKSLSVTMSIGVAAFARDEDFSSLIERADKALYASKEAGRNKVSVSR
jgi:diguanylate cyclase (GGDEF)-like protein